MAGLGRCHGIRRCKMAKTFCAWCVGPKEAARLTAKGYTSTACPQHAAEYRRQVSDPATVAKIRKILARRKR